MTDELRAGLFGVLRRALREHVAFVGVTFEHEAAQPVCFFRNVECDYVMLADLLRRLADELEEAGHGGRIENRTVPLVQ